MVCWQSVCIQLMMNQMQNLLHSMDDEISGSESNQGVSKVMLVTILLIVAANGLKNRLV